MFIDSGIWIALKYQKDKYHEQAKKLIPVLNKNKRNMITDYIILEVYAFLLRKANYQVAAETLEMFLRSKTIRIIYNSKNDFLESNKLAQRYSELSLADSNIVYHMRKSKSNRIMSFDPNFDGIGIISRLF